MVLVFRRTHPSVSKAPLGIAVVMAGFLGGCATQAPRVGPQSSPLHPRVWLETNRGSLVLELDADRAPRAAANFAQYVRDGFYDHTVFHRLIAHGLAQGGQYTANMDAKTEGLRPGVALDVETGLTNGRGTIAAVRTPGKPRSTQARFYINLADNPSLDDLMSDGSPYVVFGKVIEGMDTLERIERTPVSTHEACAAGQSPFVPRRPVVIRHAALLDPFDVEAAMEMATAREEDARRRREEAVAQQAEALRARIADYEVQAGTSAVTTDSGLIYIDLHAGNGAPPALYETVEIQYRASFLDGTKFEDTRELDYPIKRPVDRFIRGLQEALTTMNEGGKRVAIVPPELGFGDRGIPGKIPPGATIVYELELLQIANEPRQRRSR